MSPLVTVSVDGRIVCAVFLFAGFILNFVACVCLDSMLISLGSTFAVPVGSLFDVSQYLGWMFNAVHVFCIILGFFGYLYMFLVAVQSSRREWEYAAY